MNRSTNCVARNPRANFRTLQAVRLAAIMMLGLWLAGPLRAAEQAAKPAPTPGVGAIEVKTKANKRIVSQKVIQEQPAAGLEAVSIANLNGTVSVTGWDENKIMIGVRKELTVPLGVEEAEAKSIFQQIAVDGRPKGKRLEIKSILPKLARGMNANVTIGVQVPRSMVVEAVTHNGNVDVHKMKNTVTARTDNGNISTIEIGGQLVARTNNGNITTGRTSGPVEAVSSNGNVECSVMSDDVKAETHAGNVKINLLGAIMLGAIKMPKVISAKTNTGQITLDLGGQAPGFTLDAQCGVGSIRSDYPITIVKKGVGGQAKGVVGDGSVKIQLRSDTGGIRIQK